jgi:hypothetical protein
MPLFRQATFLSLLLCLLAVPAEAAVVRGLITTGNNVALSGKTVEAWRSEGTSWVRQASAASDAAGFYTLANLPVGSYRVLAYDNAGEYATSFYTNAEAFDVTPVITLELASQVTADFVLRVGAILSGVVTTSNGVLAGAIIEAYNLSGTRRGTATTNASGQYAIVLPSGDYKIFVYDPTGFYAGEFGGNARAFADAGTVRINAPSGLNLPFILERAARASGRVVDADTAAPLAGKTVYLYTAAGSLVTTTTTAADGTFGFNVGPGFYRFVAGDPSRVYAPVFYATSRSFANSDIVPLDAGEQRPNLILAAQRGAIISGRINGAGGLVVAAYNLDGTAHTSTVASATGEYSLVVAPGEYKLAVFDPSASYATQFYPQTTSFVAAESLGVLAGQTLTAIDFTAARAGRFAGVVREAGTLVPLAGKTVAVYDAAGALIAQTTTASNGTYVLPVAPAQYRVLVYDAGLTYATAYAGGATSYEATVPLTVTADATNTVDFTMSRGVRVTGFVRDAAGVGVDGTDVFALDASGNRTASAPTRDGAFTLVVVPGTYTLVSIDPLRRYARSIGIPITVGQSAPPSVTITVTPPVRRRTVRS